MNFKMINIAMIMWNCFHRGLCCFVLKKIKYNLKETSALAEFFVPIKLKNDYK